jgi:hypothetical protein
MSVSPPNSHVQVLVPSVKVFGDGTFDALIRDTREFTLPCEATARK